MRDRADETGSASLIQRGRRESDSRHCCQQLTCGFLLGLFQDFLCRSLLNDPAAVHHGDLVSEVTCHSQVMRNEQICHSQRALQIHQEIGNLRLYRTIESRKRLIQNQELGLESQCASNGQSLALATTQLRGRPFHNVGGKTDSFEQGNDAHAYLFAAELALQKDRKSTRLNSSHLGISYAVFCLKKKKKKK